MGNEFHVERLGEAEHFSADVTDAERTQRQADKPDAHVLGTLVESCGPGTGQSILDQELAGEGEHERNDRHSHRAADTIGGDDDGDAGLRAGLDIYVIVANAETSDDRQAAALQVCFRGRNGARAESAHRSRQAVAPR